MSATSDRTERQACCNCTYVGQMALPQAVEPADEKGIVCCFSPPVLVPGGPEAGDCYVSTFVPVLAGSWCGRWERWRDRTVQA